MNMEAFVFESEEPWAGAVQPAELLSEIEGVIRKHVVLNEHAAAALAVWVLHTYTFELRDAVAYVAIESPEKRCGKTTLISVLAALAHRPLIASNITVGALFRAIDTCRPTLFIDEADTFLAGNGAMRGILNSGNTWRTAYVLRLSRARPKDEVGEGRSRNPEVRSQELEGAEGGANAESEKAEGGNPTGNGEDGRSKMEDSGRAKGVEGVATGLKRYSCWCPKVIALIGEVPDTIADRSIIVKMSRKLTSESCAPLSELDTTVIRAKCARFALDAGPAIAQLGRIRGEGLNDRAADTFDPLYAIARQAGQGWEDKLQAASVALMATTPSENAGAELLLDILSVFVESGRDKLFSRELAEALRYGPDGMKSTAISESEMTPQGIAKVLRVYGIRPVTLRIGTEVSKGYTGTDFREALRRYVPRTEIDERMKEMRRRAELMAEAKAEAEKEAAAHPAEGEPGDF